MLRFIALVLCVLGVCGSVAARAEREVVAEPEIVALGEPVTLHWAFTGDKVVVTGGRFGKIGANVTGRTSLIDHPKVTTRYTFNVNYKAKDSDGVVKPLKVTYTVVVEVGPPLPVMLPYKNSNGWQIAYQKGWKPTPYTGHGLNLTYFQPEEDSLERVTVAVVEENMTDCDTLMQKIFQDMPNNYDEVKTVSQETIAFEKKTAALAIIEGRDHTHSNIPTDSLVLAFIQDGKCYVVSARTKTTQFKKRRAALEKMLRSFHVG